MVSIPVAQLLAIVTSLKGVGDFLDDCLVHLYQNDMTPGPNTVIGDFTEATFAGYAVTTEIIWGANFVNAANQAETVGDVKQFLATDGVTPNVIYGYYVTATGGAYKFGERFTDPVPMAQANQACVMLPRFALGS